ncbi:MAG TPA: Phenylacetic acid catabolic protein [bacterium]
MKSKEYESTEGMSPKCRDALRNLLIACADTKLLLGYHYGEWTFGPPQLEAAIACCSLCQSELGHVRLLHGILNAQYDDNPDTLVENRQATEFANIAYLDHEIKDWSDFVAANYLVDLAITTILFSMKESSFQPLHMSLAKMLQEERYHIHHGQGWFRTLAQKNARTKKAIAKSAQAALAKIVEWFGPQNSEEDRLLLEAGIKAEPNAVILGSFLNEVAAVAENLKLDLGLTKGRGKNWKFQHKVKWNGWNPKTRRIDNTGPEERILYHLRGAKNKVFKLN